MDHFHRPGVPVLSLAAIARSIFGPTKVPRQLPRESEALEMLQRMSPALMHALGSAFQGGLLNAEQVKDIRKSFADVLKAFADVANRRKKLAEAYDVRRETDTRLKVKATSSVAAFNEHLSEIAELASRLRDAGYLEEAELLGLWDLAELMRRCSREIIVAS